MEIRAMFRDNGIPINTKQLRDIFQTVHSPDRSYSTLDRQKLSSSVDFSKESTKPISLHDLKQFMINKPGKDQYRTIMREVRKRS